MNIIIISLSLVAKLFAAIVEILQVKLLVFRKNLRNSALTKTQHVVPLASSLESTVLRWSL